MTRSAELGSIGVYLLINDETKKLENEGVKVNAIYSGLWKLLGHSFRTLSDEERNHLQTDVTKQHEEFKAVVKAARPEIKDEALEGLSYSGDKAFDLGLTDVVCGSIEEYINEIYS
jgi:ClpP class serine protease